MHQLTADRLEMLLSQYGWRYEASGPNQWTTGFQGDQRLFPLQIRLTQTCVSFEVRPLLELGHDPFYCAVVSRDLLELNHRMQLVKLGIAEGGELIMSCQVLAAGFDYEMLSRILGIIGYYADEIAPEISQRLADAAGEDRPVLLS